MGYVDLNDFRNLSSLEEDLNALSKKDDFEDIQDEAIEKVSMSESLLDGVINVRKDYEKDTIVCIFRIVENEEIEMREGWISVDLIYYMTNHYT